jgi:uracil-DNA glycosylase
MPLSHDLPRDWPEASDWTEPLNPHFKTDSFQALMAFVESERQSQTVFPAPADTFNAFRLAPLKKTKVVILGQDPYHGQGQAHGLSFSVKSGLKLPPSLRNIYKELESDIGCNTPAGGDLSHWARQGVLLLNTVLTVREGQANSHRKQGWEEFTDSVIQILSQREQPLVFILWGKPAEKKSELIADRHSIIVSAHPSPLSAYRGFFGSRPFSQANQMLANFGQTPIDWSLS